MLKMYRNQTGKNGRLWYSAVASQPCPSGHITRFIRFATLIQIAPLRSATSHTPIPLSKIGIYGRAVFGTSLKFAQKRNRREKEFYLAHP